MDLSERAARKTRGVTGAKHPWERARADFTLEQLRQCSPWDGPVVDVGCGDCYVLDRIKQAFPATQCLGVDTAFDGQYESPPGTEVYSSVEQLAESARPAGVLLLMDVIEHVPDPVAFLQHLREARLIGPKTLIFVTVPAWQSLFSGQDICLKHYRRYRRSLLRQHLESARLQVSRSGYFFFSLLLVRAAEVALERWKIRPLEASGIVTWRGGELLSGALAAVLRCDYQIGQWLAARGISLPGLSCYALGRLA